MKIKIFIVSLLLVLLTTSKADFAPLPLKVGKIREARQNAIILFNQHKNRETLILQTDQSASKDVDAIFFMPLPSKPDTSLAPADIFLKAQKTAKEYQLNYFKKWWFETLGPGESNAPKDGMRIILQKKLKEHNLTVAEVNSADHFATWMTEYIIRNKIKTSFDFSKVKKTVELYIEDDIKFFLVNHITVKKAGQQTHPLVIEFDSKTVYYPLRVNKLYDGPSDVQIMLLSETRIPESRFTQVGFFKTKQVSLANEEASLIWKGLSKRSKGNLYFQCFRMVDPRSWYWEATPEPSRQEYLLKYSDLKKEAFGRWNNDLSISLTWGKAHSPKHEIPIWPGMETDMDDFIY